MNSLPTSEGPFHTVLHAHLLASHPYAAVYLGHAPHNCRIMNARSAPAVAEQSRLSPPWARA